MFTSTNSNNDLYQVGYPLEDNYGNEKLIDAKLPADRALWHLAHDYWLDDDNELRMDIDLAHRDAEEDANGLDGDIDTDNLCSIIIPEAELEDYSRFLKTVAMMIDERVARSKPKRTPAKAKVVTKVKAIRK